MLTLIFDAVSSASHTCVQERLVLDPLESGMLGKINPGERNSGYVVVGLLSFLSYETREAM